MTLSYDFKGSILRVVLDGQYGLEDVKELFKAALTDPRFVKGFGLLIDARTTLGNPSSNELRERAEFLGLISGHFAPGIAVVVSTLLHFGLGRMFEIFASAHGIRIQVFRNIDDAWRYLEQGQKKRDAS
jgi:hypothetical protein